MTFRDIPTVPGQSKPGKRPVAKKKTIIPDIDRTHATEPGRGSMYALSDTDSGFDGNGGVNPLHQFLKAVRKAKRR